MKIALISTLSALALLAPAAPATAKPAAPPKAPPKVLAGPSGTTVDEKTPITFRIKAHAADEKVGRWAVFISGGNDEAIELVPRRGKPSVYERTVVLHNDKVYAAEARADDPFDFRRPRESGRIFPGTVTWRVAFYLTRKPSFKGVAGTRTATKAFDYAPTFEQRKHVNEPSLPRAKSTAIVPPKSIGGVKLGMSRRAVLGLWGAPFLSDESLFDRTDDWGLRGPDQDGQPATTGDVAEIDYDQDSVALVDLIRPDQGSRGLEGWKTSKGIGLGSTRAELLSAYPNIEQGDNDEETGDEIFMIEDGKKEIIFVLDSQHRVTQIELRSIA